MPFNGSGTFNRVYNWQQDAANGIKIRADRMDTEDNGFATGLSTCVTRDGQSPATANLPMGGYRHTGVDDGVSATDYASLKQAQQQTATYTPAGGTADAITAGYTPTVTALVDGMTLYLRAAYANTTTTPTFAPDGLTAHTITKLGGVALSPGDINGAGHELILRYRASATRWELLNPATINGVTVGVQDSTFRIENSTDNTKKIAFSAASITTGNTRTMTAPDASGFITLVDATQTLSNKTIDTADNTLKVAGSPVTALTGTGSVLALQTSPSFVTPALGTPSSGNLSNCTAYPVASLSGLGTGVATLLAGTPSGTTGLVGKNSPTIDSLSVTTSLDTTGPITQTIGFTSTISNVSTSNGSEVSYVLTGKDSGGAANSFKWGIGVTANSSVELYDNTGAASVFRYVRGSTFSFTPSVELSSALKYGGVTLSNSVTGTGSMVLSTSPSLTTPTLGVASASSLAITGGSFAAGKLNFDAAGGLQIGAKTGSVYDFTLLTPSASNILQVPTGTTNISLSGNLGVGLSTSAAEVLELFKVTTGSTTGLVTNTSSGTGASARWNTSNGTNNSSLGILGQSFSSFGVYQAGYGVLFGSSGLSLTADAGPILLAANGGTEGARLSTDNNWYVGSSSPWKTAKIAATDSANAASFRSSGSAGDSALTLRVDALVNYVGRFYYGTTEVGSMVTTGTTLNYNTSSDKTLKNDLGIADIGNFFDLFDVHTCVWKDGPNSRPFTTLFAQDIEGLRPEIVTTSPEGKKSLDYSKLIPDMISELQLHRRALKNIGQIAA